MGAKRTATTMLVGGIALSRLFRRYRSRQQSGGFSGSDGPSGEVRYRVPAGQDPAAALGWLHVAGITSRPELVNGQSVLVISLSSSVSRERVRDVLRQSPENMQGAPRTSDIVTFSDEM